MPGRSASTGARWSFVAIVVAAALVALPSDATVTQVDGTILPVMSGSSCTGNLQICLNNEEGTAPPAPNAIHAVLDASQLPEVFLPNTTAPVEFKDVAEGAGFENSFGYYNVGDDVSDFNNLRPIFGCGVSAATHTTEVPNYVVNAEPPVTTTVNFAAELAAGRYKGGYIGFYLITPEGNPSANNCGDFKNGTDGLSLFGKIYFTQRDLNDDGDFVHHLVYTSRLVSNRVYFGFEDLFRGGDNDFEDMLIRVTGLTPPCAPSLEVCDGFDNDCDGLIDAADPSLSGVGDPCQCDGSGGLACQGGNRLGECKTGQTVCAAGGVIQCQSTVSPTAETCDGKDNNCNGTVDDNPSDAGAACDGTDADLCPEGVTVCSAGTLSCSDTTGPNAELCNGADDDCDGLTDEGNPGGGVPCDGLDGDLCQEGVTVCSGGTLTCDDATATNVEVCNGVDDDCDGAVDEANPGGGVACDGPDADLCAEGVTACSGGLIVCTDTTGPNAEVCNGLDDDCDGATDEGDPGGGVPCDGADGDLCLEGVTACSGGVIVCTDATGTSGEVCNGLDDDCDGDVDDSPSDVGGPCSVGVGECARNGATVCSGGVPVCNVSPGAPSAEKCNGLDDDCDGAVDEDYGVGLPCDGVGACGAGVIECATLTSTRCSTDPGGSASEAQPEICNSLDDDCDGLADEGLNDMGPCGSDVGECAEGRVRCIGGAATCVGSIAPTPEVCDGLDNDCDGLVDERTGDPGDVGGGLVDEGASCGDDTGECELGALTCVGGVPTCLGGTGPGPELCNGLDDDCDGVSDDAPIDVGALCGPTDVGACELGLTICLFGTVQCSGVIGPTVEICNGIDDDCDGAVDDDPLGMGAPCGSAIGACEPGAWVCDMGAPVCVGASLGGPELCNGIDDDCDGVIDDSPLDVGGPCGDTVGACEPGTIFCISGALQCVGGVQPTTEICNSLDDDCDGNVDEGDLCSGGLCLNGVCAAPCMPGEFDCPPGQICDEGWCVPDPCAGIVCPPLADGTLMVCNDGACVPRCDLVACTPPEVCRRTDGVCVPDNCLFLPEKCEEDEYCSAGVCVADLCRDVSCLADQFCRDGGCVKSCAGVSCPAAHRCRDGECVPTGCATDCPKDHVCHAESMTCVVDPCLSASCPFGEVCDPQTGDCIPDPCAGIRCPEGQVCRFGDCFGVPLPPGPPDAGPPEAIYASGSGGCAVGAAAGGGFPGWPAAGGLALAAMVAARARRRRLALLATLLFAAFAAAGCDVDPFYLGGGGGGAVDGGDGGGVADAGAPDGPGGDAGCVPGAPELCNERDDNCNGIVDEGFDLSQDELNCGACGTVCAKTGTRTECVASQCTVKECFPGNVDLDGDLGLPWDQTNGCEYPCFVSNAGVEACDGLDNDCDGPIDEDTDFAGDESNCGGCGVVCGYFMATTSCVGGVCTFDPATDCLPGFHDVNGLELDGCEYACGPTNGGDEICDFLDNDCDGVVDESFDLSMDPANCGLCGRVCSFPNAIARCVLGTCLFDPALDCLPGWHDVNGVQLDGCEYPCTASGPEVCNGVDDDCDGVVDGATLDAGGSCNKAPSGVATGECTDTGVLACVAGALRCVGAPEPKSEVCNGKDDDCDGDTDENPVDVGAVCLPPVGNCTAGITSCVAGVKMCLQAIGPAPEMCNGLDDDCDGETDESPGDPGLGGPCGSSMGACSPGVLACANGALVCDGETPPTSETCNGIDDDCDGVSDNGAIDAGGPCGSTVGACVPGTFVCSGGTLVCEGGIAPGPETCNSIDDDCDGSTDEGVTQTCYGGPPGTLGVGPCAAGTQACSGGSFGPCVGQVVPTAEICNAVDDDCDGATDESVTQACYTGPAGTLGVGRCVAGEQSCMGGAFTGPCVGEVLPGAETCNAIDDDCDGSIDETVTQACYTGPAGTLGVGACTAGAQTCSAGAFSGPCVGEVTPSGEICNGVDDDCDGAVDESLFQACYTGPAGTLGVGVCVAGSRACTGGSYSGTCVGQVTPGAESCNNLDDDCDGLTDEDAAGAPLAQACYTGPAGTQGVGTCVGGTQTCSFGAYGVCGGQVTPTTDRCGDVLDTDCDGLGDAGEGCLAIIGSEFRLDSAGGAEGSAAGAFHSYDARIAVAGSPLGRNVYVVWVDKKNGAADVFLRRSTDGGATWLNVQNLTAGVANAAVVPVIAAAYDPALGADRVVVAYQVVTSGLRNIYVQRSSNGGATWSLPATPSTGQLDAGGPRDCFHHDVAMSSNGTRVAVVWEELNTGTLARTVISRASIDGGANWSAERQINVNSGAAPVAGRPQVAITSTGRFVWVWRERRPGKATFDVYATRSDSPSAAIPAAAEVRLDGDSGDGRQSDLPQLVVVGQNAYVVWQDTSTISGGGSDVVFARSTTNAASWSAEVILDDPAGEVSSSFAPSIDVDPATGSASDDVVYVVWEDSREGSQVYAARSTSSGASFGPAIRASNQAGAAVTGVTREPRVAFVGASTVVVSYQNDAGGKPHVYAAASIDAGVSWQLTDPRLDGGAGPAMSPVIARVDGGGVTVGAIVVWIDFRTSPGINGDPYTRRFGR